MVDVTKKQKKGSRTMKKIVTLLVAALMVIGSVGGNGNVFISQAKTVDVSTLKKEGSCITSGKTAYYVESKAEKTVLYKCDLSGNNSKKVNTYAKNVRISAIYNKKLYFTTGSETDGYKTYVSGNYGKGKLKLEKKDLKIYSYKGKYMVGVSYESPDVSPAMLCVYNAKTKKKQELGEGYSPKIYGNKVFYVSLNKKTNGFVVASSKLGSTKKTTLATFPKSVKYYVHVDSLTNHKVKYSYEKITDNGTKMFTKTLKY